LDYDKTYSTTIEHKIQKVHKRILTHVGNSAIWKSVIQFSLVSSRRTLQVLCTSCLRKILN